MSIAPPPEQKDVYELWDPKAILRSIPSLAIFGLLMLGGMMIATQKHTSDGYFCTAFFGLFFVMTIWLAIYKKGSKIEIIGSKFRYVNGKGVTTFEGSAADVTQLQKITTMLGKPRVYAIVFQNKKRIMIDANIDSIETLAGTIERLTNRRFAGGPFG